MATTTVESLGEQLAVLLVDRIDALWWAVRDVAVSPPDVAAGEWKVVTYHGSEPTWRVLSPHGDSVARSAVDHFIDLDFVVALRRVLPQLEANAKALADTRAAQLRHEVEEWKALPAWEAP